ncbi:MAG: hypothetical protein VKL59_26125 [Nostocaceae cyanobacterium]|nr:hypothetical protein [Nostocaceae cyanobacterium]
MALNLKQCELRSKDWGGKLSFPEQHSYFVVLSSSWYQNIILLNHLLLLNEQSP